MRSFARLLSVICLLCLSAPAFAQDQAAPLYSWRMTTSWPGGGLLELSQMFADRAEKLTQGRLKIQVFPGGALGNPMKVTEAVKNGVADAGHTWSPYDWGKDKTALLFGGWAGGMDGEQSLAWVYEGEGFKLHQDFRMEKFGVVALPTGISTPEVFLHSKKPVRTLDDLKGLKLRTAGAWLELAKELGAAPITAAGSEVYQMLERGNIEATEWATAGVNLAMGFDKIAPYVIVPGYHQPTEVFEVVINPVKWEELSDEDKTLVVQAAKEISYEYREKCIVDDAAAMEAFRKAGNEIITLDPSVGVEVRKVADVWADKEAEQNEWFAKVLASQRAFEAQWIAEHGAQELH